ncbi:uncharacterized protein LOC111063072 isoform X3 [Nilaparvata lugens]|uniref:uncharacterized protein LOC111063072 isoform X3 n=1 Tax=Nilaparvata lugens TaxID=108931 RepID=UPI00193E3C8A|nr:uncharacterized protein LOC111063072 isoform X3 [Nilaparvata lugens]
MDLRTIIASCLIPVLFGFLAEALPPHYYSQSPAALPTRKPSLLLGRLGDRWRHGYDQRYSNHYNDDSIRYLCPPGYEYDPASDECIPCPPGTAYDSDSGTCVPFYDSRLGALGRLNNGHHRANAQYSAESRYHTGHHRGQGGQGGHKGSHNGVPQQTLCPRSSWWIGGFYGKPANK